MKTLLRIVGFTILTSPAWGALLWTGLTQGWAVAAAGLVVIVLVLAVVSAGMAVLLASDKF